MPSVAVFIDNEQLMRVNLVKDIYVVGRQEGCDIHIDNLGISRNHSRLVRQGESYTVEDLGSSNGTYVNAEQAQRQALNEGDIITIGKYELRYSAEAAPDAESGVTQEETRSTGMDFDGAINTMAMDGEAMRKRMQEMRAKDGGGDTAVIPEKKSSLAAPVRPQKKDDVNQTAEIRARDAEIEMLKSEMARNRMIMIAIALVAVGAIVAAILLSGGGGNG